MIAALHLLSSRKDDLDGLANYCYQITTMSISDSNKKRGRPPTGIGKAIGLRLYPDLEHAIDVWIDRQEEADLSKPEAIRRLLEQALQQQPEGKKK